MEKETKIAKELLVEAKPPKRGGICLGDGQGATLGKVEEK